MTIRSFGDRRTEKPFRGEPVRNIQKDLQKRAIAKLDYINEAERLDDLRIPPSNRLEKKKGDLKDFYSIRVNSQWRIIFRWADGNAMDVTFIDYH